ncbi:MinD/ParA family protein [Halalkalibacter urbisdiaboli]|uniref:MinD/ParA family protein n=1 Tax=Halalkalibacter urbisdiaboli TaxID=1960589 RepID=UPI000B433498|nr:MinD/ParA family protein [Halalkalibacter urbisdiaboli]
MNDQAESLRRLTQHANEKHAKVIAVVSGKGGVGKSNVCLNFAISLSKLGNKVAILDLDIGMANLDILMGLSAKYHIVDMLENQLTVWDIIEQGPANISYLAGGSGFSTFIQFNDERMQKFFQQLELIEQAFDYIFLDMGAGATRESIQFILAAHEVFVVTTPEPTSMTDAYAMVKYIYTHDAEKPLYLMVNRAESEKEGKRTIESFQRVASQFLKKDLLELGFLPNDKLVIKAVKSQTPFVLYDQKAKVSSSLQSIVKRYIGDELNQEGPGSFIKKMRSFFK